MNGALRTVLIGRGLHHSLRGIAIAAGMYGFVLLASFLPISVGELLEPGLVVVGIGLASWWAYNNSGVAVCVSLVLFPVLGRLTYYSWLYTGRPSPVALPLSFSGTGAWAMWIPLSVVLGVVAFGVGAFLRRVNSSVETGTQRVL